MADIALVSLALDSSAVVAGEKQATRALQTVDSAMQRTEKQAAQLNTGLNANLKKSGDSFKGLADGASRAGAALSGLGGPVGKVASDITNLGGQMSSLTDSFGLAGGAALGAVGAIAAIGSAVVKLTLDGIRLSASLNDMGQALGFSREQMERLNAAARLSGEDVGAVERAFATFQGTIKSALADPTSDASSALRALGIDAKEASRDTQGAFLNMLRSLSEVTKDFEQLTAAREVFGRGTASLIRTSEEFNRVMGLTNQQLEDFGYAASAGATKAAADTKKQIDEMSLRFDTFKRDLADDWLPGVVSVLDRFVQAMQAARENASANVNFAPGFGTIGIAGSILGAGKPTHPQLGGLFGLGFPQDTTAAGDFGKGKLAPLEKAGKAARDKGVDEALKAEQELQKLRLAAAREGSKLMQDQWDKDLADLERFARELNTAIVDSLDTTLVGVGRKVGEITKGVPLAAGGAPPIQQVLTPLPTGPAASTIRTEEQARLDAQFALIFDDFMVTLLTAQDTLGGAFKGLALGLADTFAIELTKAMRESFINFLVPALTELLQEGISSAIGGLKGFGGGGVKGVFGGILKGIGTIFGGLFATGGTLAPGKFGIAGERGPELLYSGNQPLHIAPVSNVGGSGVISVNMNFAIAAPTGEVSQRTQDQIADSAMRGMERAQRLRGAR